MKSLSVAALCAVFASPVFAGDVALVLSNIRYDAAPTVVDALPLAGVQQTLEGAGFRVIGLESGRASDLRRAAADLRGVMEGGDVDRVVILVSGHLMRGPRDTWLMGRDARDFSALGLGDGGISLSALMQLAEARPGQALLLVAGDGDGADAGAGATPGLGHLPAPQGVTVVTGQAGGVFAALQGGFLDPTKTLTEAANSAPTRVRVSGFVTDAYSFMGSVTQPVEQPDQGELSYWSAVQDIGGLEPLEAYLRRYPQGRFAVQARQQAAEIRSEPLRQAQTEEEALNLSRDARREVQRNLSLLGFDPKGIDGLFGRGSRAAIAAYQRARGLPDTGYLSRPMLTRLGQEAAARAAQLEAEARQRQEQEAAADRQWWNATGRVGDEAGLRAYLNRYPDGEYAAIAQERLDQIEAKRRAETRGEERAAWDSARESNTIAGFRQFLDRYPQSGFADAARARIEGLQMQENNRAQIEVDRGQEGEIAVNEAARLVIETRLAQLKLEPGRVDGKFDQDTRRAIRRFQRNADLPVTGFVGRTTMVRLMSVRDR